MSTAILDRVWDGAGDAWAWLRGVVLGEWEDHRSISQIVADALAGFVPGLGSTITLRDVIAVIVRLAKFPDKRDDVDEWILLIAMLLPLLITVLSAFVGGVGALAGAELGGFLRALVLLLVKEGGVGLKALVQFFQHHGYGDVVKALREVKFARYKGELVKGLGQQLDRLASLVRGIESRLRALDPPSLPHWLPGREQLVAAIAHCAELERQLEEVREAAAKMIPAALIELDRRLGALLAGNVKAATQVTYTIRTGQAAPEVARLQAPVAKDGEPADGVAPLHNPGPAEPGNTRRVPERRLVARLPGREYGLVDHAGRPVGAKPYEAGVTRVENPPVPEMAWRDQHFRVKEGWPDLADEYAPDKRASDYKTFSGSLNAQSAQAGSRSTFKRLVSHDEGEQMDRGAFWNRELPVDGEEMRSGSAIKEDWNKDGEYVELRVPPPGDPVWKELNTLQEGTAGMPVPHKEELRFWEGPAASQVYKKEVDKRLVDDDWYLPGGKPQQFFDREQMKVLKEHGFITQRKATHFPDFDPEIGNIVPKDGPHLEWVPPNEAMALPRKEH
jgi:hypothetical protein